MENKHSKYKVLKLIFLSCLWIGLLIWVNPAYSQVETKVEQQEQVEDSIVQYITPMEYAFMMHEATSWMVKVSANISERYYALKLGIEKRISPSFTLNLSIAQSRFEVPGGYWSKNGFQTSLEGRWYYLLNNHIKHNKVARSMSDNYFALGLEHTHVFGGQNTFLDQELIEDDYATLFVKWGLQRRFMKHGLADVGVKLGIMNALNHHSSLSMIFGTYVDLGLAFTRDNYQLDREKLCPVFKCYEGYDFIIKSNLSNLIGVNLDSYHKFFHFSPQIAIEQKVAGSTFSINSELSADYSYDEYNYPNNQISYMKYWNVTVILEGRWYYNLNRRIAKGKTGNGLSANYMALGGSYTYYNRLNYNDVDNIP